jgi:regulator of sigma E protease
MFIIFFILILLALVIIHEFGHYIAAKKSGVRVEEFGFGLPPRVFGWKFGKKPEKGEDDRTLFSLNWIPAGGFVRLTGEDAVYKDPNDPKNFQNAPLWKRMMIVLAGVFMNFILGIALFATVYSFIGIPTDPPQIQVLVQDVVAGAPAEQAGIRPGDVIIKANDTDVHVSEFGSEEKLREKLELGKTYNFKINLFDPKEQKMALSFIEK